MENVLFSFSEIDATKIGYYKNSTNDEFTAELLLDKENHLKQENGDFAFPHTVVAKLEKGSSLISIPVPLEKATTYLFFLFYFLYYQLSSTTPPPTTTKIKIKIKIK